MSEEVWDTLWGREHIKSDYSLKYIEFMQDFVSGFKPGSRIIEVGCGTGQTLELFSGGYNTTGIDISANALKHAHGRCDNPTQADMFYLPFKDESFDLVYNSGVIEHFPDPQNTNAVREMARVTKKGGSIVIIVPNSGCIWYRVWKYLSSILNRFEFGYEEDYSIARLKRVVTEANPDLKVEKFFGLQVLLPLATNKNEILPEGIRTKIGEIEKILPKKEYYAYAMGVIAKK
jgi:SAM-dependent methyltransferase